MSSVPFDADLDALAAARSRIDALDAQLLDVLAHRADATAAVRAAKGPSSGLSYRPARESAMFQRLLSMADPRLSRLTVYALFREIISASIMTQTPFRLEIYGGARADDIARLEFGAAPPRRLHTDPATFWAAMADRADAPHPIGIVGAATLWPEGAPEGAPDVVSAAPLCGVTGPQAFVLAHIQPDIDANSRWLIQGLIQAPTAPDMEDAQAVGPNLWSVRAPGCTPVCAAPAKVLGAFAPTVEIAL